MDVREYDLNLIPGSVPEIVKINQYDKGIQYAFTIYQGEKKFSIPAGSTVLLTGTKPDGLGFTYSCTFSGAVVSVTIGDQVAVLNGKVDAEITIISSSSVRLGTANCVFLVEPAALQDDTAVSDSDFPAIVKAADHIDDAKKYADNAAQSAKDAKASASSAASAAKNAIADEVTRAKAAEAANAKAITDETARAKKAEQANSDAIATKMTTKTYDADGDGMVDNAAKVNGHSVESDVPADAVFTDTVYDDSAVKKSISDETDRAKKAEEANTKLANDLKTGLTSGTVKVAKATSADSATALGSVTAKFLYIPDNGARKKYLLFYDISEWISKSRDAGTYAYDGYFFSRRSGGFVSNNYTGTLSMVASYNGMSGSTPIKSDDSQSLRLRTTSEMYKPVILHNTSTNKYYLALETYGNGRDLVLFGIFQGTFVGTWVQNVGQSLTPGTLPDGYELYSEGYVSIPYERAIADKNGNDIAGTYIKDLSASGNTITYTRGDGTTGNITIGS